MRIKSLIWKLYLIWECYEHEKMARPDMEVVWIQQKRRFPIVVFPCWYFQFNIFVPDIFLLIVHSTGTSTSGRVDGKDKWAMS